MRLIDADALDYSWIVFAEELINKIKKAPTIEAEPVVRCKDCNHWKKDVPGCTDFVGRCGLANYMIGATGYCVYAERKAEEK